MKTSFCKRTVLVQLRPIVEDSSHVFGWTQCTPNPVRLTITNVVDLKRRAAGNVFKPIETKRVETVSK